MSSDIYTVCLGLSAGTDVTDQKTTSAAQIQDKTTVTHLNTVNAH